ncbi:hypothetical protein HELRODRAFT_177004 [Helobdella robusta]|uniref:Uncharacterized protein n=1 Tax=Helobdella robusta TaxID=6412 RepID=T1FB45_HELRO|nr:hypothetical protein HELRODRAFT_177004 [Helobdella robusta]ESN98524.1 hypothetical protein HELRODRAFT_177004 [Helobdella robusta]
MRFLFISTAFMLAMADVADGGVHNIGWSAWNDWSACDKTCGVAISHRTRECLDRLTIAQYLLNSDPEFNCVGKNRIIRKCDLIPCSGGGGPPSITEPTWGDWSEWSTATVTCSSDGRPAYVSRSRDCLDLGDADAPSCEGNVVENKPIPLPICCINGTWGSWSRWSTAGVTCLASSGDPPVYVTRTRVCDSPPPSGSGFPCPGSNSESKPAELPLCGVDGSWGAWTRWSSVSITCNQNGDPATIYRSRDCDNPAPSGNGMPCPGDAMESRQYPLPKCPVNGVWSSWSRWSSTAVSCTPNGDSVTVSRIRSCDSPAPSAGGMPCTGSNTDTKPVETPVCPVNGGWSVWTQWSSVAITCTMTGNQETVTRTRQCNNPTPVADGMPCSGSSTDSKQTSLPRCCTCLSYTII